MPALDLDCTRGQYKERYADDPLRNGELIKTVNSATIGIVDEGAVKPRHPFHTSLAEGVVVTESAFIRLDGC